MWPFSLLFEMFLCPSVAAWSLYSSLQQEMEHKDLRSKHTKLDKQTHVYGGNLFYCCFLTLGGDVPREEEVSV